MTLTSQRQSPTRPTTMSPAFNSCAGFVLSPLSCTRPPATACCARLRVLKKRAAQSHLSKRRITAPLRAGHHSDGTGDARTTEAAIARRVLAEVLLVIVLGVVELRRRADFGGDGAKAFLVERLLERFLGSLRRLELLIAVGIDGRAVLRAGIVALAHALRRVVAFPENLEQLVVAHDFRIEYHYHDFSMVRHAAAD